MSVCHGNGNQDGGCCYISGNVCPHRLRLDYDPAVLDGLNDSDKTNVMRNVVIYDANDASLGTIETFVNGIHNGKPRRDRVIGAFAGRRYICGVLANTVIAEGIPTGANWEADFEVAWSAQYEPGGSAQDVGDAWAAMGKPRNWCVSFGPGEGQCCFRQDDAANAIQVNRMTTTSVAVASRSTMTGG